MAQFTPAASSPASLALSTIKQPIRRAEPRNPSARTVSCSSAEDAGYFWRYIILGTLGLTAAVLLALTPLRREIDLKLGDALLGLSAPEADFSESLLLMSMSHQWPACNRRLGPGRTTGTSMRW